MEICSERMRIDLVKSDSFQNRFRLKIYPSDKFMAANLENQMGAFSLSPNSVKTDVDIISLIGELLDSVPSKNGTKKIFPVFDDSSKIFVNLNSPIIQYSFEYEELMEIGKLEKNILAFDLSYNSGVNSLSLLIIEAITLTREVFKWQDLWLKSFVES
ncbi:MAG: hypothetical protein IJH76_06740 [Clostridia bacterium]|nr:hypothetical protein [Clostridia bacterium]